MALMFGLSYVLIAGIFPVILAGDDHLDRLPSFLGTMGFGFGVVLLLCVLVMLVVFRNRMRVRFVMDDEGLTSVVTDRRAQIAGSLALVAGAGKGNATLTGAGLAQQGGSREYTAWRRVSGARLHPWETARRPRGPRRCGFEVLP